MRVSLESCCVRPARRLSGHLATAPSALLLWLLVAGCIDDPATRTDPHERPSAGQSGPVGLIFEEAVGRADGFDDVDMRDQDGLAETGPTDPPAYGAPPSCDTGFPPDTLAVGASVAFEWVGTHELDGPDLSDATVDGYAYKLTGVDPVFVGGTGADTAAVYDALPTGTYTFLVQGRFEDTVVGETCRYFHVNHDAVTEIVCSESDVSGACIDAYRIATREVVDPDCDVPGFASWSWEEEGLPEPPFAPDLPPGMIEPTSILPVAEPGSEWWIEVDVVTSDVDGTAVEVQLSRRSCSAAFMPWDPDLSEQFVDAVHCPPRPWECASVIPLGEDSLTVVVGPLTSGDWELVLTAIDDQGQRSRTAGDTLLVRIDRFPVLYPDRDGLPLTGADRVTGTVGDTLQLGSTETLYTIREVQAGGAVAAPCPVATSFAETGEPADLSVHDLEAFPRPGEVVDLVFERTGQNRIRRATMYPVQFAEDRDLPGGDPLADHRIGWVTRARWKVDVPPAYTAPWEPITDPDRPREAGELTPMCFEVDVIQSTEVADHVLYLEIRDWDQRSFQIDGQVAERTTRYAIPFTARDVSGRRYAMSARHE